MSDTESDQENDNARDDFDEMFEPDVDKSASFALDTILQILGNDDQAYNQSMDCMHSYHTASGLR